MAETVVLKELGDGIKIPMLGLGLGAWQVSDDANTIEEAVEIGLASGYRHFDTTHHNDRAIGRVINSWLKNGKVKREDLFITSKLPLQAMWPYRVNEYLREALKSLELDYVDLYLIQFPVGIQLPIDAPELPRDSEGRVILDKTHLEPIWKAMEKEVKNGRTRSIGLCDFNQEQLDRILNCCIIQPAIFQTEINIYFQQKKMQSYCKRKGIAICAYGPLGLLDMTELDTSSDGCKQHKVTEDPVVQQIARKYGKTPTQIVLRFLIQSGVIAVPKCLNPYDIKTSIKSCAFSLKSEDMTVLQELNDPTKEHMSRAIISEMFSGLDKHPEFPWTT